MIVLQGLTKKFPNGRGIFDLSFKVAEGEVFGYLGPNGAGKSTTIRHLMGFLRPDSGLAQINSLDCWTHAAKVQERVGYLPGEIGFLDGMNGLEFLNLLAGMRKLRNPINLRQDGRLGEWIYQLFPMATYGTLGLVAAIVVVFSHAFMHLEQSEPEFEPENAPFYILCTDGSVCNQFLDWETIS